MVPRTAPCAAKRLKSLPDLYKIYHTCATGCSSTCSPDMIRERMALARCTRPRLHPHPLTPTEPIHAADRGAANRLQDTVVVRGSAPEPWSGMT